MPQFPLLLLGCVLSWKADTAVASVVLDVALFGTLFYLLIVVAG